jgi:hypothetical protein
LGHFSHDESFVLVEIIFFRPKFGENLPNFEVAISCLKDLSKNNIYTYAYVKSTTMTIFVKVQIHVHKGGPK